MNSNKADVAVRLLFPKKLPPMKGALRIALHSMLQHICEENQFTVHDLVHEFSQRLLDVEPDQSKRWIRNLLFIDSGNEQSDRFAAFLREATGLDDLAELTLQAVRQLSSLSEPRVRTHRKWCPNCYLADVRAGMRPYDRLIWSLDIVKRCPLHDSVLVSACPSCGIKSSAHPYLRDVSGFCPRCLAWLGLASDDQTTDDYLAIYEKWTACGLAELLGAQTIYLACSSNNLCRSIRQIIDHFHDGTDAQFARQIGRNRSVVSTWLKGTLRLRWESLCDISFVYQIPHVALLSGNLASEKFTTPRTLPDNSDGPWRKKRGTWVARSPAVVEAHLRAVIERKHPTIDSLPKVAAQLNMDLRELYRLAPQFTKKAAAFLHAQRSDERALRIEERLRHRNQLIDAAVASLHAQSVALTRRTLWDEMGKLGYSVEWKEGREILALARANKTLGKFPAQEASGISEAPAISGN